MGAILSCEGGGTLAWVLREALATPSLGSVQHQIEWSLEQSGLVKGVLFSGRVRSKWFLRPFLAQTSLRLHDSVK